MTLLKSNQRIEDLYKRKNVRNDASCLSVARDDDLWYAAVPRQGVYVTFVTKVILGTMGCTPAYDINFKRGLPACGVAQQRFGERSLTQLEKYYCNNLDELEKFRMKISRDRVAYTPMKILDMCFWQFGYDADKTPLETLRVASIRLN